MADLPKEQQLIREVFTNFYESLDSKGVVVLSGVLVQVDLTSGDVTVCTPGETVSSNITVYNWISKDTDAIEQRAAVALPIITGAVESLKEDGYFDQPIFEAPITVRYSDGLAPQDRVILEMVDDWSVTDTPLLPDSEKELGVFLTRLLAED